MYKIVEGNNKKGISLIVLVITIIIIIIIAGVIISSMTGRNVIEAANDAIFKHNLSQYNSEFRLWSSNEILRTVGNFNANDVIATNDYGNYNGKTLKDILPDIKKNDLDKIEIIDGNIEQIKPIYTDKQLDDMIKNQGYVPIASSNELNNIRYNTENTFGQGTKWEKKYTGGVDKKYVQVKEVIMTNYSQGAGWVPIEQDNGQGNSPTYFSGVYDGNGYGILGMHIDSTNNDQVNVGLFSQVSLNTAEYKNIYIQGFDITTGDKCKYTGSLLGYSNGCIKTLDNIHVTGKINGKSGYFGGIIGYIYNHNENAKLDQNILNCYANVNINSSIGYVGGIVAYIDSNANITLKNISIKGTINIMDGGYSVGGIVSYCNNSDGSIISLENCNSSADINVASGYAGGLINYYSCYSSNTSDENKVICIKNCYVTGNIIFKNNKDSNSKAGGLIRQLDANYIKSLSVAISDCYYIGNIINVNNATSGLVGYLNNVASNITITNCYSKGNIIGTNTASVGGLIGYVDTANVNLSNCYSCMKIQDNGNSCNTGGLIGYGSGIPILNIDNCYYDGDIIANKNIGGLIGRTYWYFSRYD